MRHTQCVSGHHVCLETACVTGDIIWTQCVFGGTMCIWWNNVNPELVRHVYLKRQYVSGGHNALSILSMPQSRRVPEKSYKPRCFNTTNLIPQGIYTKCNTGHYVCLRTHCIVCVWRHRVWLETHCVSGEALSVRQNVYLET